MVSGKARFHQTKQQKKEESPVPPHVLPSLIPKCIVEERSTLCLKTKKFFIVDLASTFMWYQNPETKGDRGTTLLKKKVQKKLFFFVEMK